MLKIFQFQEDNEASLYGDFKRIISYVRDGPLFFYCRGGVTIFGTCRQFFLRVMHFKQFFSLHFVMKTIFLRSFLKILQAFL